MTDSCGDAGRLRSRCSGRGIMRDINVDQGTTIWIGVGRFEFVLQRFLKVGQPLLEYFDFLDFNDYIIKTNILKMFHQ